MKSPTNVVIKRTVKSFLQNAKHISEADLKAVEEAVKKAIEQVRPKARPSYLL